MSPENLNVSRDEVEGNIEIRGKQNSLFPKEIPAITCNSGQHLAGNSELFPVCRHSFAMLPAHGIWQETVSLLDVM